MDNRQALNELDYYVIGHDEAKKALISLVTRSRLRHYQKYMKSMDGEFLVQPMKVLLLAKSGTGKTHLVESLQKVMHFPLVRVDATQLNPAGSSGGIKQKDLQNMIIETATDVHRNRSLEYPSLEGAIDRTVVFVDEIDKLGRGFDTSGNWNKHVQSSFLTMFDNKVEFSGVSFVFAGAFTNITDKTEDKTTGIGFTRPNDREDKRNLLDDEIVKSGLIPEIVGRMTHIIKLDNFDRDMYFYILKEKILPKKLMDLAVYGVFNPEITDDFLVEMAEKAHKSGQGVRYLQRAVDRHFLEIEFTAGINYTLYNEY